MERKSYTVFLFFFLWSKFARVDNYIKILAIHLQFVTSQKRKKRQVDKLRVCKPTKEIKNAPSALLSYISTWEFLRTREKCGEARAEGLYTPISKNVVGENGEWHLSNRNCTTKRKCGFHLWYAKTMCSSRGAKLGSMTAATKPPQICIFDNEKQYFCTLCTCIFHLLTF